MFASLDSNRLQEERQIWLRAQKHGKIPFIFSRTFAIGSVLSLFIYPIRRHYAHENPHGLMIFVLSCILCLFLGYLTSELAWRRGLRLINEDPAPKL
jgi:hypothetical protein